MPRIYVGHIPYEARERDVERFFKGYGRIRDILMKRGYCFVEFSDPRDADDAVYDLDGRTLLGSRVAVEIARSRPYRERGYSRYDRYSRSRSRSYSSRRRSRSRSRSYRRRSRSRSSTRSRSRSVSSRGSRSHTPSPTAKRSRHTPSRSPSASPRHSPRSDRSASDRSRSPRSDRSRSAD